jgi:hypothetical protein
VASRAKKTIDRDRLDLIKKTREVASFARGKVATNPHAARLVELSDQLVIALEATKPFERPDDVDALGLRMESVVRFFQEEEKARG